MARKPAVPKPLKVSPSKAGRKPRKPRTATYAADRSTAGGTGGGGAWMPTEAQRRDISAWVACGVQQITIAWMLGVDKKTLTKHCADELTQGKERQHGLLVGKLMAIAMNDDHAKQLTGILAMLNSHHGWAAKQMPGGKTTFKLYMNMRGSGEVQPRASSTERPAVDGHVQH